MALDTLDKLLIEQLQDIYYAEKQLVKALPRMAKRATTPELKEGFTNHAAETEEHVSRLEQVFEALGVAARAKKCPAIEGLIQEAAELIEEDGEPSVIDAGLIASAQRVEHYEMAAYGNVRAFAGALGHTEVVTLLDATLTEEHAADQLLTEVSADRVLPAALALNEVAEQEDDGEAAERPATAGKHRGTRRSR
jgi:ferritin-like metal-binding protein YciE